MRFRPVTPARLAAELAEWIDSFTAPHARVGIDGPAEIGTSALADAVAAALEHRGRPVVRVSTRWWWRPASLRLEVGRTDVDMLLSGWVDVGALRRELLDPLAPGGSGRYLRRLRDPDTDRSIREPRTEVAERAVLLIDGPFLLTGDLRMEGAVHLQVSPATVARVLPPERQWWLAGFARYLAEDRPAERADVLIAYDHPAAPAFRGSTSTQPDRLSPRRRPPRSHS